MKVMKPVKAGPSVEVQHSVMKLHWRITLAAMRTWHKIRGARCSSSSKYGVQAPATESCSDRAAGCLEIHSSSAIQ
jgi:hypothetical protein